VGAPAGLMRLAAPLALRASVAFLLAAPPQWTLAATASYVVSGNCRDGRPHGAYELRMPDGKLRVAGAFNHGKRIGSFLFWSASGARIALLPFDDDAMNGTVALWYLAANAKTEPKPKLEAVYANGLLAGGTRSWYPDGRPRAEYRYDQGVLAEARAWSAKGALLPEKEARALAVKDKAADEQFYNTLEAIVHDHPPPCEANGSKP
jgi:antitoxin component YwqK of YwqJK toxin-antitoxin module